MNAQPSLAGILAANTAAWSRRMAAIPQVLRWLCEQLVRALLWGAWLQMLKRQGAALDRAFARFGSLVDVAPCWPCRVSYQHPEINRRQAERGACGPFYASLCITAGAAADYDIDDDYAFRP